MKPRLNGFLWSIKAIYSARFAYCMVVVEWLCYSISYTVMNKHSYVTFCLECVIVIYVDSGCRRKLATQITSCLTVFEWLTVFDCLCTVQTFMKSLWFIFHEALTYSRREDDLSCWHGVKPLTHSLIRHISLLGWETFRYFFSTIYHWEW